MIVVENKDFYLNCTNQLKLSIVSGTLPTSSVKLSFHPLSTHFPSDLTLTLPSSLQLSPTCIQLSLPPTPQPLALQLASAHLLTDPLPFKLTLDVPGLFHRSSKHLLNP
jgi:hypothetical protein